MCVFMRVLCFFLYIPVRVRARSMMQEGHRPTIACCFFVFLVEVAAIVVLCVGIYHVVYDIVAVKFVCVVAHSESIA